jgi:hypothetical protein
MEVKARDSCPISMARAMSPASMPDCSQASTSLISLDVGWAVTTVALLRSEQPELSKPPYVADSASGSFGQLALGQSSHRWHGTGRTRIGPQNSSLPAGPDRRETVLSYDATFRKRRLGPA